MRTEIILQHGWGFDGTIWQDWCHELEQLPDCEVSIGERGYYGRPLACPEFSQKAEARILITHSLGLHLVPQETLKKANALIMLGGFLRFHPSEQLAGKRSKRVTKAMLEKLKDAPDTVLADFMNNCYSDRPAQTPLLLESIQDKERLESDLRLLDTCDMESELLQPIPSIMIMHGWVDAIVPYSNAIIMHQLFPGSKLISFREAGHALPFSHANECVFAIKHFLTDVLHAIGEASPAKTTQTR